MKAAATLAAAALVIATGGAALAQGNSQNAPGQHRVCLVSFSKAGTEANADVTGAKVLPRKAAEAQVNDTTKIYECGDKGSLTEEACNCLNDPNTRATCNQPVMK